MQAQLAQAQRLAEQPAPSPGACAGTSGRTAPTGRRPSRTSRAASSSTRRRCWSGGTSRCRPPATRTRLRPPPATAHRQFAVQPVHQRTGRRRLAVDEADAAVTVLAADVVVDDRQHRTGGAEPRAQRTGCAGACAQSEQHHDVDRRQRLVRTGAGERRVAGSGTRSSGPIGSGLTMCVSCQGHEIR